MWILPFVGYLGYLIGFLFLTLSIASGLYYLSELVEEHTVIAKRFLTRLIYTVMGIMVLLWAVDGFPILHTLTGLGSHVVYLGNMRRFPNVKVTDGLFMASCVLVLFNHWIWMGWFSQLQQAAYSRVSSYYEKPDVPSFIQVASYFALCVWIIPFSLFISLSAGENVLPTINSEGVGGDEQGKSKRQGMIKAVIDSITGGIGQVWTMAGGGKGRDRDSIL
jgi:hypothetical protein